MKATADNAAADWGPTDMGLPQTLVDFIDWARANYPARHYALSFYGTTAGAGGRATR